MRKIFHILIFLGIITGLTYGLYQNQVGKFDWSIKNIGDIEKVVFLSHKVAFVSKDNVIGVVSNSRGSVEWSKDLSDSKTFIDLAENEFVVLDAHAKTLNFYDFNSGLNKGSLAFSDYRFPDSAEIVSASMRQAKSKQEIHIGVATKSHAYLFVNSKLHKSFQLTSGEYVDAHVDSDILSFISKKIKGGELEYCATRYRLEKSDAPRESCYPVKPNTPISWEFSGEYFTFNRGPENFLLSMHSNQALSLPGKFYGECGVLVAHKGDTFEFSSLKDGSFHPLTKLKAHAESGFTCGSDINVERAFIVVEPDEKSVKVHRIDLDKSTTAIMLERQIAFKMAPIQHVYFGHDDEVKMIVKTQTLQTVFINKQTKATWKREESLSQIKHVEYFDLASLEEKLSNPYFEYLDEHGDRITDLVRNFIVRVTNQAQRFILEAKNLIEGFSKKGIQVLWEEDSKFEAQNGLIKLMVVATHKNTIYGLDSKTGEIQWERLAPSDYTIQKIFKVKKHHETREALVYLTHNSDQKSLLLHIDSLSGVTRQEELNFIPVKIIKAQQGRQTFFILVKDEHTVQTYPTKTDLINGFTLYWIHEKEINGYSILGEKLVPSWNFKLDANETIVKVTNWAYDHEESSFSHVIAEEMKVIYKFADSNNFAVLTSSDVNNNGHLNLYILNGVTGRLLSAKVQPDVDLGQPIDLVFDENGIFISYYNTKSLFFEIWSHELYRKELESSFKHLLKKHWSGETDEIEEDKYNLYDPPYIIYSQKYFFPPGIKSMNVVQTKKGITKKNILIVTLSDQIYSLDRSMISTRRAPTRDGKPITPDSSSFMSTELPPYSPFLNVIPIKFITYYQKLVGINKVVTSPTHFESTALLLGYGHDLFFTRFAPEKEFDMLNEDFNYLYLLLSVVASVAGVFVIKRLELQSRIQKIFVS